MLNVTFAQNVFHIHMYHKNGKAVLEKEKNTILSELQLEILLPKGSSHFMSKIKIYIMQNTSGE